MKKRKPATSVNLQIDLPMGTRERILEVARALIAERGNAAISLVDLAEQASVSRQTLYLLFGSRAGLLLALVDHLDNNSAIPGRLRHVRETLPAREAVEPYIRAWLEYLPVVFPIARALSAAATTGDEDARAAWDSRMKLLRSGFGQITRGLHEAGQLREGWTPASAAHWMYSLTHVDMWHHLVVEGNWRPAEMRDRILATLNATLLRDV